MFVLRPVAEGSLQERSHSGSIVFTDVDSDLDGDRLFAGSFGAQLLDADGNVELEVSGEFGCHFPEFIW